MSSAARYVIGSRLGRGGMAEVFEATSTGTEGFKRPVAIKRILPGYSEDASFAQMFVAEAQISARLAHPNIVATLDFDRDEGGALFLVMELVDGVSLDALMTTGALPPPLAVHLAVEILRGLGYAHAVQLGEVGRGVVHRDVSPHNVLLSWDGVVKVSDFGLAKSRGASRASASVVVKGKAAYMSPEHANGEALDGRSDLFAVGIILWELLTGQRLFQTDDMRATMAALFFRPIANPRSLRGDIDKRLDRAVMKLLERDLVARYATAEAAIHDLLPHCPAGGGSDLLVSFLAERVSGGQPSRVLSISVARGTSRRRWWVPLSAAAAICLAIGITVAVGSDARPRELKPVMADVPTAVVVDAASLDTEGLNGKQRSTLEVKLKERPHCVVMLREMQDAMTCKEVPDSIQTDYQRREFVAAEKAIIYGETQRGDDLQCENSLAALGASYACVTQAERAARPDPKYLPGQCVDLLARLDKLATCSSKILIARPLIDEVQGKFSLMLRSGLPAIGDWGCSKDSKVIDETLAKCFGPQR